MKTKKKSLFAWFGRTVAVGLVPLMLFGCASNSDDDDKINGNVVNANPPQFSTDPSTGNTITGTSVLRVSFNEAVTGVTNGTNVVLKNGSGIVAPMTHTAPTSGNTYTFDPNPDLTSGTYYLTVGAGTDIVDSDKQAATPSTVIFTVDDARTTAKAAMNAANITATVVTAADTAAAAVTNNLMSVIPAAMGAGIAAATDNATKQSVISSLIGSANGAASLTSTADRTITRINDSSGFTTLLQLIGDTLTAQAVAGKLSAAELQSAITTVNTALTAAGADTDQLSGLQSGFNTAISGDVSSSTLGTEFSTAVSTATGTTSSGTAITGTAYVLQTTVDDLRGTSNNDTFTALQTGGTDETFGAADAIDGGAGTDTLTITNTENGVVNVATVSNVENIVLRSTGVAAGGGGTIDMANFTGETSLTLDRVIGSADVNSLGLATTLNLNNLSATADSTLTYLASDVTGTADAGAVIVNGVVDGAEVDWAGNIESFTVTASTAASRFDRFVLPATVTSLTIAADQAFRVDDVFTAAAITSLTVTGAGAVTITPALATTATTVNASGTGAIALTMPAAAQTITTGSGNDTIDMQGNLTTSDTINLGDGTDTLQIDADGLSAGITDHKITNVEAFKFDNMAGNSGAINMDTLTPTSITVDGVNGASQTATAGVLTLTDLATTITSINLVGQGASGSASDNVAFNGLTVDYDVSGTTNVAALTININNAGTVADDMFVQKIEKAKIK